MDRSEQGPRSRRDRRAPVLVVVVCFLNEMEHLPRLLGSIETQSRLPDSLVLVDDGSTDGSDELANAFARRHPWAVALRRPPRVRSADRLAGAAELQAFQWGLAQIDLACDVVVKLDSDLQLAADHFGEVLARFEEEDDLGIAGAH